jgi:hypothetical protein
MSIVADKIIAKADLRFIYVGYCIKLLKTINLLP